MQIKLLILIVTILVIVAAIITWQVYAYNAPQPSYRVIKSDHAIEIREYPTLVIAEVSIPGERYASINAGFRLLANYIFGNNQQKQTLAMTAPVIQQQNENGWAIRFIMPANFTKAELPSPENASIKLETIKEKRYLVIRFSGRSTDSNIESHTKELTEYAKAHQITTVGTPILAFYNPPWILPFLRRNEVMLEIKPQ
jgi:hypothetical protein